jgi:hypothetical protein
MRIVLLSLCLFFLRGNVLSAETKIQIVAINFGLPNGPDDLGSLAMTEQDGGVFVQIPVANRESSKPRAPAPDLSDLHLQVWLLKADGTAVLQKSADRGPSMTGGLGAENWFVIFHFAKVPRDEIGGVVFRRQGKLYCQKIAATDWKPL